MQGSAQACGAQLINLNRTPPRFGPRTMIILLSGWAGSGKDAAALLLEEMNFVRLAFADAIKIEVAAATGIPLDTFHDHRLKDIPIGRHHGNMSLSMLPPLGPPTPIYIPAQSWAGLIRHAIMSSPTGAIHERRSF